jgi:hypothetical protein
MERLVEISSQKSHATKGGDMHIDELMSNPHNPRQISDGQLASLMKSIKEFPEMLNLRPIVIDENNIVLGGNMRLLACRQIGITDVPVVIAKGLTEEQKKEFIIKDNLGFGEWDWDILANEWDVVLLDDWGLELPLDEDEPAVIDEQTTDENLVGFIADMDSYVDGKKKPIKCVVIGKLGEQTKGREIVYFKTKSK